MVDEKEISKLIDRCKQGDEDAFEKIIDIYGKRIYNLAYKYVGNYHDADDISQQVFIKIYKNIKQFKGECAFMSWIYTILSNTCKDYFRKTKRIFIESLDKEDENGNVFEIPGNNNYIEDILLKKYQREIINASISKLDFIQKEIIILREIYNYSYQEIAIMLKISEGTVKSRLSRARDKLKNIISSMEQSN